MFVKVAQNHSLYKASGSTSVLNPQRRMPQCSSTHQYDGSVFVIVVLLLSMAVSLIRSMFIKVKLLSRLSLYEVYHIEEYLPPYGPLQVASQPDSNSSCLSTFRPSTFWKKLIDFFKFPILSTCQNQTDSSRRQ